VIVGTTGLDLEIGSSYKNHWPESQQILLPENSLIKNNRFIRLHDGPAVSITVADSPRRSLAFASSPIVMREIFSAGKSSCSIQFALALAIRKYRQIGRKLLHAPATSH